MVNSLSLNQFSFALAQREWGPWSFTLPESAIVGMVGPNGAGKSSFFRALLGEAERVSGEVRLGTRQVRGRVAMIPQESPYPPEWTVEAAVSLAFLDFGSGYGKLTEGQRECRAAALEQFGLREIQHRRLGDLSSGQRQRVFLCRVSLQSADLLLLDEPTNHLDPPTRDAFWHSLLSLRKEKNAPLMLVATHDLAFLKANADHVVAISAQGRVVFEGASANYWGAAQLEETFGRTVTV